MRFQRRRCRRGQWAASLCGLLVWGSACAQGPIVRTEISDDESVWVGQRVEVIVELLAPGYFASAAKFDLPDPEGVLLMPPSGSPVVGTETIDGTRYTVQRHTLSAWPMRAGDQSIPAIAVRFGFRRNPLDDDQVPASLTTSPVPFTVSVPPGAANLGTVISARDLEVVESWSPEPGADDIPAGTAFTRTITFSAPNVPGMIFPPFPAGEIEGLGVYSRQQIRDQANRGTLSGERRDEITYVCEQPGRFTVPATQFTWFDLDSMELRTETLPARTLTVVENTAMASADTGSTAVAIDWLLIGRLAGGLAIVALAIVAVRRIGIRKRLAQSIEPFRPVHLQTLNPRPDD